MLGLTNDGNIGIIFTQQLPRDEAQLIANAPKHRVFLVALDDGISAIGDVSKICVIDAIVAIVALLKRMLAVQFLYQQYILVLLSY